MALLPLTIISSISIITVTASLQIVISISIITIFIIIIIMIIIIMCVLCIPRTFGAGQVPPAVGHPFGALHGVHGLLHGSPSPEIYD